MPPDIHSCIEYESDGQEIATAVVLVTNRDCWSLSHRAHDGLVGAWGRSIAS